MKNLFSKKYGKRSRPGALPGSGTLAWGIAAVLSVFISSQFISVSGKESREKTAQNKKTYQTLPPVADQALQKRLVRKQSYVTRGGESLLSLAHLFYGHKTWWKKLRKQNPRLRKYGPRKKLKRNLVISYQAAQVGNEYIVQRNDWLSRIALWRYGSGERWHSLFEANRSKISNPNLIHPGDRLLLTEKGIVNQTTGKTVLKAWDGKNRTLATSELTEASNPWAMVFKAHIAIGAFLLGLLIFTLLPKTIWMIPLSKLPAKLPLLGGTAQGMIRDLNRKKRKVDQKHAPPLSSELAAKIRKRPGIDRPPVFGKNILQAFVEQKHDDDERKMSGYHRITAGLRRKLLKSNSKK